MNRHTFRAKAKPPAPFDLNPRRDPALDFGFRALDEMTPKDYDTLGFICGLEVHQQLDTKRKLFCRCPAGRRVTRVDGEVLRHMRPTLSELGEYDGCALMEFKTSKEIVYLLERSCVCTYEMDDTPPFPIDTEAVKIALEISRLFGLSLVSEMQVMRKQYLDGSIPTGFQRTAMVALGSVIPFRASELGPGSEIRIRQLTIEEDSCREVTDEGHRIVFRTDRLGTPLVETVTEPDLLTPRDVATGGRLLAQVARASGKVRRGAGAARQDVNVSVAGSRRVELKGVCQHRGLPQIVHTEAFRQLELMKIRATLLGRGITEEMLTLPDPLSPFNSPLAADARHTLRQCGYPPVEAATERGDAVSVVRLPGFDRVLGVMTQPGTTFAREFADRVRVIACLTARPFMISSHVADHGFKASTWKRLRSLLKADPEDALVVVWGPMEDVETAIREILQRGRDALVGVPSETRQVFPDRTTGMERILPGPERMYPDTDTPPIPIPDTWVETIEASLPEPPWVREARYEALGLSAAAAARLTDAPWEGCFAELAPSSPATARRLASAFEHRLPPHWLGTGKQELPGASRIAPLLAAVDEGQLRPEAFDRIFDRLLSEEEADANTVISHFLPSGDEDRALADALSRTARERTSLRALPDDAVLRWAMGRVMPSFLGKTDPLVVRRAAISALDLDVAELEIAEGGRP